jgi:Protein of unknown function (DUF1552)
MTKLTSRRALFEAVGSATLLSSVVKRLCLSADNAWAAPTAPKRLIVFWTPNGVVQDKFWPMGNTGSDFTLNEVMKPLEPHKKELTILKGVRFNGSGDHKTGAPFSTTARLFDASGEKPEGPSIDTEIGAALGTTPLVLCGQSKNENRRGYISFAKDGSRVVPIREPKQAYAAVFGNSGAGGGVTPDKRAAYNRLVLETAVKDAEELQSRLPTQERIKMEEQLEALTSLKKQYEEAGGGGVTSCASADGGGYQTDVPAYATRMELHLKLIAMAFACDKRRVVSLMTAPHGHDATDFGFLGINGEVHNTIAHHYGEGPQFAEPMAKIAAWQAGQLANLVTLLKKIPEGDKTVFDNTVILWTSECSTPNHGTDPIPMVLLGSAGGFFLKNRFLSSNTLENPSILMSLAHALGHKINSFGLSSKGPATVLHA